MVNNIALDIALFMITHLLPIAAETLSLANA
jgi:hypothetical protein